MSNILITGGAGFVGSHTARALLNEGHRVRIVDLLDPQIHGKSGTFPATLDRRVDRVKGDIRRVNVLKATLDGVDAVYHFAAKTGVGQSMYDWSDYVDTNVGGTAALFQTLSRLKRPIQRVILSSSRAIYGEGLARCAQHGMVQPPARKRLDMDRGEFQVRCPRCYRFVVSVPTMENAKAQPASLYALSKKHQEDLALQAVAAFDTPVVILRYFNVFGSCQSLRNPYTGVVTVFFNRIRQGKNIALYEDGAPTRDFVHVSDVVRANVAALNYQGKPGEIFNVGSGRAITIKQLAVGLGKAMGHAACMEQTGEFRVGDIRACTADLTRSRKKLGYHPQTTIEKGLEEFVTWAKKEAGPAGSYEKTVRELRQHRLFGRANQ
jgi:dTDP-L-rhamnose 4-epimerase